MSDDAESEHAPEIDEQHIRAVRLGHGANCSSIGSVIDALFASAAIGGAIFAAIAAAMKSETVTVVGNDRTSGPARSDEPTASQRDEDDGP